MTITGQFEQGFWQQHDRFLKNVLLTEQPHPETGQLSELAQQDVDTAIAVLKAVDLAMLKRLANYADDFVALQAAIATTVKQGGKVFICGCGATGRLAVSVEICWRKANPSQAGLVVPVIAGGDTALIHSIEKFEDQAEYGIRQLQEQGFSAKDLLIAASAGGESPFVLAAAAYAAGIAEHKPWLIYCNPNAILLERNHQHPVQNPKLRAWSLQVGAMALTGSTRMQATTALMLAIGLPLLQQANNLMAQLNNFVKVLSECDFTALKPFIIREAELYQAGRNLLYVTDAEYGLTVLTDTTERAPTFNLPAFENRLDLNPIPAYCYLKLREQVDSMRAWQALLGRAPQALNWSEFPITSTQRLYGFDFSEQVSSWRALQETAEAFSISQAQHCIKWCLENLVANFCCAKLNYFWQQVLLKLLLNIHSTLVMGRLRMYEGNLMTSVNPSNYKLVDRAIRYTRERYKQLHGKELAYQTVADVIFTELQMLKAGESIVHKALARLHSSS